MMMALNGEDKKALSGTVDQVARMLADIKEIQDDIKLACDAAADKLGIKAKTVRQLAKEKNWNESERAKQQEMEQELDACRSALGLLADTPLGEAAQDTTRKNGKAKGKAKKPAREEAWA